MSLLPRLLALSLFVVLTALTALLWLAAGARDSSGARPNRSAPASPAAATVSPTAPTSPPGATAHPPRVMRPPVRMMLPLAVTSLVLAAALLVCLAFPATRNDSRPPFAAARAEFSGFEQLARASAAQGEALARERDVRARAEENARLNELRLTQSVENQVRLGRDLHDGIIQSLYATGLIVESTRRVMADPATADHRLAQAVERINGVIRDVRACISGLTPAHVRRDGFARAIRSAFDELNARGDAFLEATIDESAAAALTADQETELLQITREACSNSLRHGRARKLTVRLHPGDGAIALLVQDDGAGFDPASAHRGHGRANIEARAARLGATLSVQSRPGAGARIVLTLPLAPPAESA